MFVGGRPTHRTSYALRSAAMVFEDVSLDELRALLGSPDCEWLHLFVEISRFAPNGKPASEQIGRASCRERV